MVLNSTNLTEAVLKGTFENGKWYDESGKEVDLKQYFPEFNGEVRTTPNSNSQKQGQGQPHGQSQQGQGQQQSNDQNPQGQGQQQGQQQQGQNQQQGQGNGNNKNQQDNGQGQKEEDKTKRRIPNPRVTYRTRDGKAYKWRNGHFEEVSE